MQPDPRSGSLVAKGDRKYYFARVSPLSLGAVGGARYYGIGTSCEIKQGIQPEECPIMK